MTQEVFDNYRLNIMYYYSDLVHKMVRKATIGSPEKLIDNDLYILLTVRGYIDILLEYTLFTEAEEDTNFFDRATMKQFVLKINDIFNTNFELDFIKT